MLWPPPRRTKELVVALPTNVVSELSSLREKTERLGFISRSLIIFRVSKLVFFKRKPNEGNLIKSILTYHLTPPYLRKYIPLRKELKFVGLLPPLRSPFHAVPKDIEGALKYGYRVGYLIKCIRNKAYLDVGLRKHAYVLTNKIRQRYRFPRMFSLKLINEDRVGIRAKIISERDIPFYWGYKIGRTYNSLRELLGDMKSYLKIATSRHGILITDIMNQIRDGLVNAKRILVLFGGPKEGLYDIARDEGFNLKDHVDFTINFIPKQGAKTVRTEEALLISLGIINLFISS